MRVLDSTGSGTVSGVLRALDWVMTNRTTYNIRVVNMSLGALAVDSYKIDPLCKSVRKLVDAGDIPAARFGPRRVIRIAKSALVRVLRGRAGQRR